MNTYRRMLADKIESNGGYSRGYHDRYPIEYTVGLYYANLDIDHIYKVMCETQGYLPPPTGLEWDEDQIWGWTQEGMCDGLNDGDTQRTYSPDNAKRFGFGYNRFPRKYKRKSKEQAYYPAKKPGWVLEDPYVCQYFDVKFGLAGRGGKHLVVLEFEGHKLEGISNESLVEMIRDPNSHCSYYGSGFSNGWCHKLLVMMHEWEQMYSSKEASKEMEYQAASYMHNELSERADAWRKALKKARSNHAIERAEAQLV